MQLSASRLSLLSLLGLLLLAVALRWDVYPKTYFADELIPLAVIKHMQVSGTLDTNWEHADWRGDFAGGFYKLKQYNFSSYHTALYLFQTIANGLSKDVSALVVYRAFSLLCQLLAIFFVYRFTRNLYGERAAIFSSAFLVIVPQAVVDAHYARPESFVMFLVALACWLAWKHCEQKKQSYALLEAVVWGVAFACKFSFMPMIMLAFAVSCVIQKRWMHVLLWLIFFVLGVAISAPYILKDISGFLHGVGLLTTQYAAQEEQGGWMGFPSARQIIFYLAVFFTVPVFLVMLVSGLQAKKNERLFFTVAVAVSTFYLFAFAAQGVFFERNFSHLLPLWAVLFGAGSDVLLKRMKGSFSLLAMRSLLCLCVGWLLYLSVQIDKELFLGLAGNKQRVADYESELLREFSSEKVIALNVMNLEGAARVSETVLLRVPMPKVDSTALIAGILQEKGFERVATINLPLAFLPYSQLQINQLPPAYAYYRKTDKELEVKIP